MTYFPEYIFKWHGLYLSPWEEFLLWCSWLPKAALWAWLPPKKHFMTFNFLGPTHACGRVPSHICQTILKNRKILDHDHLFQNVFVASLCSLKISFSIYTLIFCLNLLWNEHGSPYDTISLLFLSNLKTTTTVPLSLTQAILWMRKLRLREWIGWLASGVPGLNSLESNESRCKGHTQYMLSAPSLGSLFQAQGPCYCIIIVMLTCQYRWGAGTDST